MGTMGQGSANMGAMEQGPATMGPREPDCPVHESEFVNIYISLSKTTPPDAL
jgi:hypothetical protein